MQEEELSVSEILSSIRESLSKEMQGLSSQSTDQVSVGNLSEQKHPYKIEPIRPPVFKKPDVILELTPQMRVEKETFLPAQNRINPLLQQGVIGGEFSSFSQPDLKPMMQDWLDKNLPSIVEKVVAAEVKRLFSGK